MKRDFYDSRLEELLLFIIKYYNRQYRTLSYAAIMRESQFRPYPEIRMLFMIFARMIFPYDFHEYDPAYFLKKSHSLYHHSLQYLNNHKFDKILLKRYNELWDELRVKYNISSHE